MSEPFSPLEGFNGTARLFPLPNLVFFPHVMQPLHIFEPRYRQMIADALASDRFIALVLPRTGWESNYSGAFPIHSVGAIGKIVSDQKLEDGRYNILLKGLSRIQIVEEVSDSKLYRKARVELLAEVPVPGPLLDRKWRRQLAKKVPFWFADQKAVHEQFNKLLMSDLPLGPLCDILAFALPLEVDVKQKLLEELEVEERLAQLMQHMKEDKAESQTAGRKFPPDFSAN